MSARLPTSNELAGVDRLPSFLRQFFSLSLPFAPRSSLLHPGGPQMTVLSLSFSVSFFIQTGKGGRSACSGEGRRRRSRRWCSLCPCLSLSFLFPKILPKSILLLQPQQPHPPSFSLFSPRPDPPRSFDLLPRSFIALEPSKHPPIFSPSSAPSLSIFLKNIVPSQLISPQLSTFFSFSSPRPALSTSTANNLTSFTFAFTRWNVLLRAISRRSGQLRAPASQSSTFRRFGCRRGSGRRRVRPDFSSK